MIGVTSSGVLAFLLVLCPLVAGSGCSGASDCTPNDHTICRQGSVYWVDTCGVVGQKIRDCECGCNVYFDECQDVCDCVPECDGKCCGFDGCDGTCPDSCADLGQTCHSESCLCEGTCQPNCEGKTCGPDGCDGLCQPGCLEDETCSEEGTCLAIECGGAQYSLLGTLDTGTADITFDQAVFSLTHKIDPDELEDGCVVTVEVLLWVSSGCQLRLLAGKKVDQNGVFQLQAVELEADSLCPDFGATDEGNYSNTGGLSTFELELGVSEVPGLNLVSSCVATWATIRLEGDLSRASDGVSLPIAPTEITISGDFMSSGSAGLICPCESYMQGDLVCDGLDDDCDGQTDEDAAEIECPKQIGFCAGATQVCQGAAGYSECDYGPDYTGDLDDSCNQLDNDCDGLTDEDAQMILAGEDDSQASDGLDNNCNGLVDEPGGIMVRVNDSVAMDAFEAVLSGVPECDGSFYGQVSDDYPAGFPVTGSPTTPVFACSRSGLLPSGYLSWPRARWACEAQGKRLCTATDYQIACSGGVAQSFPYSTVFVPGMCNDAVGGAEIMAPTGVFPSCLSVFGAWDMSGNMAEWLGSTSAAHPGSAHMAIGSYECEICENGASCRSCIPDDEADRAIIESMSDCFAVDTDYEVVPFEMVKAYYGTRCCWDIP